ncbi:hypothetical protein G8759_26610 [Spirosoma aureum]|uniref:Immunoglobulin domain-containing protein n=1 Tax=Spirosoma aureum TaxID=2692134 RepID=A0A6G9AU71_9BACT|nr:LamG-like jellyroll fold domain-containing protein [Spirosoma aureum]QIP15950.1 hypothetical protein G8759_26610 [Spirosoma aureum]
MNPSNNQRTITGNECSAGSADSTTCNFTPTASTPATANCSTPITLTSSCSGSDCTGITTSWSGNGINADGTGTTPSTPGTYIYTLTMAKAGCDNQSTTTSVEVSCEDCTPLWENHYKECDTLNNYRWYERDNKLCSPTYGDERPGSILSGPITQVRVGANKTDLCGTETATLQASNCNGYFYWVEDASTTNPRQVSAGIYTAGCIGSCNTTTQSITITNGSNCTPTSNPCDFAPTASASPQSVSCGQSITLSGGCQGTGCADVSYQWTTTDWRDPNGQSTIHVTAPQLNQTIYYELTLSKPDCPNQSNHTATAAVDVTCGDCSPLWETTNTYQCTDNQLQQKQTATNCGQYQEQWLAIRSTANPITITPSSYSLCNGSVMLTLTGCTGAIAWADSPYNTPNLNGYDSRQIDQAGTYTAFCYGSSGLSCDYTQTSINIDSCTPTNGPCAFSASVSPARSTVLCSNTTTFQGVCTGECAGVYYNWNGPNLNGETNADLTLTPNTAGIFVYTFSVSKLGCDNVATTTAQLDVSCTPPANPCDFAPTASATPQTVTCGQPITLIGGCQGTGCDGVVYRWSTTGWTDLTGQASLTLTAPNANQPLYYELGLTKDNCPNEAEDATSVAITISCTSPANPCDFTSGASTPATALCNSSITLTGSCSGAGCNGVTYSWSGNGISGSNVNNTITTPGASGTYIYTLTMAKAGCDNQSTTTSVEVSCEDCTPLWENHYKECDTLNNYRWYERDNKPCSPTYGDERPGSILSGPITQVRVGANKTDLCGTETATLQASNCNGYFYWVEDASTTNPRQVSAGIYTAGCIGSCNTTTQSITITNGSNCTPTSDSCAFSASVNPANSSILCNTTTILQGVCSGECGGVSHQWEGPNLNGETNADLTLTPNTAGTFVYTFSISKLGCAHVATATAQLNVSCGCTPTWEVTSDYRCEEGQLQRKWTNTNLDCPTYTDEWRNSDPKASPITITPSSYTLCNGSVMLTLTGCTGAIAWADSPYNTPNLNGYDSRQIDQAGTYTAFCYGSSGLSCDYTQTWVTIDTCTETTCSLTATASASPQSISCGQPITLSGDCQGIDCGNVIYTWLGQGVTEQAGSSLTLTAPATTGTYEYTLTLGKSGCSNTVQATTQITVSCQEPSALTGTVDETTCTRIRGWLVDVNNDEQSQKVRIYIDGVLQATVWADGPRPDVRAYINQVHGATGTYDKFEFNWAVPTVFEQGRHEVRVTDTTGNWEFSSHPLFFGADAPTLTPTSTTICAGQSATLTAGCTAGEVVWSNGGTGNVLITGNLTATISYTATCNAEGCLSPSATVTVVVIQRPVFGFSAAGSNLIPVAASTTNGPANMTAIICSGDYLTLSDLSWPSSNVRLIEHFMSNGVAGLPTTRPMNDLDAATAASIFNQRHGPYTVDTTGIEGTIIESFTPYVDTNGNNQYDSDIDCTGDSITLFYQIIPTPAKPVVVTASCGAISTARSVTLTASGCSDMVKWELSSGTSTGPAVVVHVSQTTTFGARCTNAANCQSDTAAVTVHFLNLQAPTVATSTLAICSGESVTLSANGCESGTTIKWSNGMTGSSITFNPATTTTYYAICQLDCAESSNSNQVQIMVRPGPTVSGIRSYTTGQTISLTATAADATSYIWYGPAGFTSTGAHLRIFGANTNMSGSYTVVASYAEGGCSPSTEVIITVNGPVIQTQTITPSIVCAESILSIPFSTTGDFDAGNKFTAQLSDSSGSFSSPLSIGETTPGSDTSSPISATLPASVPPGNGYRIRVISSNPLTEGEVSPTVLTINALPTAPTLMTSGTQVCSGTSVTLTATCSAGTVRWSTNDSGPVLITPALTSNQSYSATCEQSTYCVSLPASVSLTTIGSLTIGEPLVICTSSSTTAIGSIVVSTTLSQPNQLVVQYQLESQQTPDSYSVVSPWSSSTATLTNLPVGQYRLSVRGVNQDVPEPTTSCGLVTKSIRIDALSARASSYSTTSGSPVSLWVEGTPFNNGNALWTNEGATFSPSSQPQGLTNTFTWEAWVKPDNNLSGDNTNENYVLYPWFDGANYSSAYAGLGIATGKDGIRLVGHTANYLQQILDYRISITDWTHIAVVFQDNVATLLINGQVKASNVTPPQGKIMYPSNYVTGLPWSRDFGRYKGAVDEVRLWNTARSTTEIARDYKQVLGGQETGLLAYWRFEFVDEAGVTPATGNSGLSATVGGNPETHALVPGVNTDLTAQTSVVTWTAMPGSQTFTGNTISVSPTQSTTYTVTRSDLACSVPIAISVVQAPCNLTAVANSYSIVAGSPVSLWIEGTPFNSSNALYTNQGLTFTPSSQPQSLTGTFTWEAWIKPDVNLSGDNTNERYVLYPRYDGSVYSSTYAGLGIAAGKDGIRLVGHTANYLQQILDYRTPITDWTHVAVVFQNNVATLLIDGIAKVSNMSPPQNKIIYPYNYITGVPDGEYGRYWGAVDEVRLWNTARSTTDIARDYKRLLTGQEAGLLSYWQFESIADNKTQTTGTAALSAALGGSSDSYKLVTGINTATAIQTDVVSWTALPGGQTFTGNTIAVTPAKSTTYVVSRSSNPTCTTSVGISVGILPCSFSLVGSATPTSLSCGSPVSLSVAPSGPVSATAGTITYAWSGPGPDSLMSFTQSGQSFTTVPASATTSAGVSTTYTSTTGISTVATSGSSVATYSVTATQGFCTTSGSVSVVLTGAPSLSVSSPQAIYREGESLTLTAAMSSTVAGPIVYDWTGPNSYTGTGQKVTVPKATTAMAGSYTVVATIPSGCTISASLLVKIIPDSCSCQDCDAPEWQSETISVGPDNTGTDYANIVENTYLAPTPSIGGTTEIRQQITYLDGFGRPIQINQTSASPSGKDIVLPIEYDGFGRAIKNYLPYTDAAGGGFKANAVSIQSSFYQGLKGDGAAFSTTLLEQSPLQRLTQQGSIGAAWQPNGADANKTGVIKEAYRHNTETNIPQLTSAYSGNNWTLSRYAANQLFVNETKDATNNKVEEFTDLFGQTICKKVYSGAEVLTTYYAYDDFGRLRFTFPPKAAQKLESQADGSVDFTSTATVKDQIFWYVYDARGRVVEKKTPDAALEEMVYNLHDQVVLYRNGMHRSKSQWMYSKYDEVGRIISKGVYASANSRDVEQAAVTNSFSPVPEFGDAAYPTSGVTELSKNYYDDYAFTGKKSPDQPTEFGLGTLATESGPITLIGKLTGTKETILKASGAAATAKTDLLTTYYYDQYGRVVQTRQENHLGGEDLSSVRLDFAGRTLETKLTTNAFNKTTHVWTRNTYDRGNRLKMTCQRINDGKKEPVGRFTYNELGEVTEKWQGCKMQVITYQTDIRGRLTSINSSDPVQLKANKQFFGMKLEYTIDDNVSAQVWGSVPHLRTGATLPAKRRYEYSYDPIGRLKGANYTGASENFSVSGINYDLNGNLLSMVRRVSTPSLGDSPNEDNLSYTYAPNSNQLRNVQDAGVATPTNPKKAHYFNDRNQTADDGNRTDFTDADDYAYDAAGNLIRDLNRDIRSIDYNVLGLPETITFGNQTKIYYLYTSGGDKLQKQGAYLPSEQAGPIQAEQYSQKQIDYSSGVVYTDQAISFIPTAEGRALPPVTDTVSVEYRYEYQQTDHLGNLRSACHCGEKFDETGKLVPTKGIEDQRTVVQENHYDPWGLNLADIETQPSSGLDWWQFNRGSEKAFGPDGSFQYDTDFRQYDPTIGRFGGADGLAGVLPGINPYMFGFNSPAGFNDPTGLFGEGPINGGTLNVFVNVTAKSGPGIVGRGLTMLPSALSVARPLLAGSIQTPTISSSSGKVTMSETYIGANRSSPQQRSLGKRTYNQNKLAAEIMADPTNMGSRGGAFFAMYGAGAGVAQELTGQAIAKVGSYIWKGSTITLYRGTSTVSELRAFNETGMIMSDAATNAYVESSYISQRIEAINAGMNASRAAHARQVATWWGEESSYVQAHSAFSQEIDVFGPRSMTSWTDNLGVAKSYMNGGKLFRTTVGRWKALKQTLPGANEGEYLIKHGVRAKVIRK